MLSGPLRFRVPAFFLFVFIFLTAFPATDPHDSQSAISGRASGIYALDRVPVFNSLDGAFFDSRSGRLTLFGHRDPRYHDAIPYLEHLSVLLEEPRPEFSLDWTKETKARVDRFMHSVGWAQILDKQWHVSRAGAYVLQSVGVYPTRNKSAPGFLGLHMDAVPGSGMLKISAVDAGSPAALAGMKSGEIITAVPDAPLLDAAVIEQSVRTAGAGSSFAVCVQGKKDCYRPVLAAASGDPWASVDSDEVAAAVLRSAGHENVARIADAVALWHRVSDTGTAVRGIYQLFGHTAEREKIEADITAGKLNPRAGAQQTLRRLCEHMDEAVASHGQLVQAFDAGVAQGGEPAPAFVGCLQSAWSAMIELKNATLTQLTARPGGIPIPPAMVEEISGFHFEVVPRFIHLNPGSLLAGLMEDADYKIKSIVEKEELSVKVPGYQTEPAFEDTHPGSPKVGSFHRVWITPQYIDAAQSTDGSTLMIRGIKMRFNIRNRDPNGKDLAPTRGGFQDLLTSLYDDLSTEYPVLNELREASKLALVAEWIRSHNPALRLPAEGRRSWTGPATLPGISHIYLRASASPPGGAKKLTDPMFTEQIIRPSGGVHLSPFPEGNSDMRLQDMVGTDPSIRPFPAHDGSTTSAPGGVDPAVVYSGMRQPIPVRLPQAAAWAGSATVDGHQVNTLSVGATQDVRAVTPQNGVEKALALWKSEDLNGAEQKCRELLQQTSDPRQKAALKMLLFGVLEEKGDTGGALKQAADAHVLDPDNPKAYLIYIKALSDNGDVRGAAAEMTKYVALDPNNKSAQSILAKLRQNQNQAPGNGGILHVAPGVELPQQLFGSPEANSAMAEAQFDALQATYSDRFHPTPTSEIEKQARAEQLRLTTNVKIQFMSETAGMSRPQATQWLQHHEQELQAKSDDLKQQIEHLPPGPQKETLQAAHQEVEATKQATQNVLVDWDEEKPAQPNPSSSPTPTPGA